MFRKQLQFCAPLLAAGAFALAASGQAAADDNSMSQWTGESYAYFNNLDYSLGKFNTARAPRGLDTMVAAASAPTVEAAHPAGGHVATVARPVRSMPLNPFRDDTGD